MEEQGEEELVQLQFGTTDSTSHCSCPLVSGCNFIWNYRGIGNNPSILFCFLKSNYPVHPVNPVQMAVLDSQLLAELVSCLQPHISSEFGSRLGYLSAFIVYPGLKILA